MSDNNERMHILELIDSGDISAKDGAIKLDELGRQGSNPAHTSDDESSMDILEDISSGKISAAEGTQKLKELGNNSDEPVVIPAPNQQRSEARIDPEEMSKWKRWWMIPMWVGIGITILSGMWMNAVFLSSGYGFWFFFTWLPLSIGVTLIYLGSASRNARWLHVRIKEKGRKRANIAISFPLPIRFSTWVLRIFGKFIPGLDTTLVDELIVALDKETADTPFYVKVNEHEDGEQVEVFIG